MTALSLFVHTQFKKKGPSSNIDNNYATHARNYKTHKVKMASQFFCYIHLVCSLNATCRSIYTYTAISRAQRIITEYTYMRVYISKRN
jgi:hypothetical protein